MRLNGVRGQVQRDLGFFDGNIQAVQRAYIRQVGIEHDLGIIGMDDSVLRIQVERRFNGCQRLQAFSLKVQRPGAHGMRHGVIVI